MAGKYVYVALLATLSIAAPPTNHTQPACAEVSRLITSNHTFVDSDLALRCLQSVPLDKEGDALQLAGLKTLLQFQSDISYKKNPPPGYLYPAVDLLGAVDELSEKLESGFYTNEYDLQVDIFKLISAGYDGHMKYYPDIVNAFTFQRLNSATVTSNNLPDVYHLFSVSPDGFSLPNVYGAFDLPALAGSNASQYKPSPIVQINGDDVEDWLNHYATTSGGVHWQDPDANYNMLFPNIPEESNIGNPFVDSMFTSSNLYQGTDTALTFANGTTRHLLTLAVPALGADEWQHVTDGTSFFKAFCSNNYIKETKAAAASSSAVPAATSSAALSSSSVAPISTQVSYKAIPTSGVRGSSQVFPSPIAIAADGSIAGYFPDSQLDLAVLAIPNYGPTYGVDFEDVTRELLATAKASGKTKLIVDLRGNPGGTWLYAYDTFHQLFPSLSPYGAGTYRAQEYFNFAGEVISDYYGKVPLDKANKEYISALDVNYQEDYDVNEKLFSSWQDFYGPHFVHQDNYTSLTRFNMSDRLERQGIDIYGYGNDDAPQPQTFAAQDIVLLQDGVCASTCTVFTEFMKTQGHVRQIVVGGRKQYGPMQGVGGIKGSNDQDMAYLEEMMVFALQHASEPQKTSLEHTSGVSIKHLGQEIFQTLGRAILEHGDPQASVNYRNNIRQGDTTETPLQYVYEAADCRFFYTADMLYHQELVWQMTYDLAWGNGTCVQGSTGQASSQPGTSYINAAPPPGVASNDTIFPSNALGNAVPSATPSNSASTPSGSASKTSGPDPAPTASTNSAADSARLPAIGMVIGLAGSYLMT